MAGIGNVKQYKGQPQYDWSNAKWLQHAWVMVNSPWIDEEEREYWRDKIAELSHH